MAKIGYTTGVFDLFHIGHLNILRSARSRCDRLIAGVTSDELSLARKNKRPIVPLAERMEIVAATRYVDQVVVQATMNKYEAWLQLGFDMMFVGDDWKGTPVWERYGKQFSDVGVEIVYLPYTASTSSTQLRMALDDAMGQRVAG